MNSSNLKIRAYSMRRRRAYREIASIGHQLRNMRFVNEALRRGPLPVRRVPGDAPDPGSSCTGSRMRSMAKHSAWTCVLVSEEDFGHAKIVRADTCREPLPPFRGSCLER